MTNIIPIPFPNRPLDFALRYADLGWHVLPLFPIRGGECACGKGDKCGSPGKHPYRQLVPIGQKQATTDKEIIKRWWNRQPDANIGIFLEPSKLCAIDIDPRNGGHYTFEDLEHQHGKITSDCLQFTGGGGEHLLFSLPANLQNLPGKLGAGIDLKLNGYIVVEPSNHISGGVYEWEGSSSPLDGCIPSPLPDWIRDMAWKSAPTIEGGSITSRFITDSQIEELRAALQ
ncbi:MAG: bifunctional DNA primase/polymerase, partial [Gammaproteobacteria bacterium]